MIPALILLIFGLYYGPGSQIPHAKFKHSMANGQPVRGHHKPGASFTLKPTLKTVLKSLFINRWVGIRLLKDILLRISS